MLYFLCLFNTIIAEVCFKEERIVTVKSYNNALLPFGSYKIINNTFVFNPITFNAWWYNRIIPDTRKNIRKLLQQITCASVTELVLSNLGLSLTDCYWLKPANEKFNTVTWEQINLYTNVFDADIGFQKQYAYKTIKDISPDTTLNGNLPKFWNACSDGIYLLKGCNGIEQRIANEVFASFLHRKQGCISMRDYVSYNSILHNGELYSNCPNICSVNVSMAFARDLLNECKTMDNQIELYNFITQLNYYGVDNTTIQTFLDYMILSDFVMSNCDRHMNNIGILYSSYNKQILGFAPLYDFGDSMFYNYKEIPIGNELLNMETSSFYKYEIDMLKIVKNPYALSIECLPNKEEFYTIYSSYIGDMSRIEDLYNGYLSKIRLLEAFQQGEHIWHRRRGIKRNQV